jgi:plasmid stabilization system protein ParE
MAHRVVWSRRALQDLEAIAEYIAEDSQAYAAAVVKNIVQQTRQLAQFPRSSRKVPEFDDENIREVLAYSYRIIYRLQGEDEVLIAAVIHGKRILQ